MARSINSPGVQITETDLSFNQQIGGGTTVFVPGYAPQGPIDEILLVTTISEFEKIYGAPTTPAERYFYHTCKEVLNSPATLLTTRLPYGSASGAGFSTQYSALLYPVLSTATSELSVGAPKHITLTEVQYDNILQNNIKWAPITNSLAVADWDKTSEDPIEAGIMIVNSAQTTINEFFEGYYVTLADNTNFGPDSDFNSIGSFYSLSGTSTFAPVASGRLGFALSGTKASAGTNSISEVVESVPTYNFGDSYFNDSLILNIFRVRNSIYEPQTLTYSLIESYIGSLDANKKTVTPGGGATRSAFLGDLANNSSANIKLFVNPNISQKINWTTPTSTNPSRTVRITESNKAINPLGVYGPTYEFVADKEVGNTIKKLERVFSLVETSETVSLDIVVDGGLTTISANASGTTDTGKYFTDATFLDTASLSSVTNDSIQRWRSTFNVFNNFVANTRRDCVFIADPLRQIFVNGEDTKTISIRGNTFSTNIYTPLKACFSSINTNYATTYGNWVKTYDVFSDKQVWVPASGFAAAIYAKTDANTQPWIAPAGLNRGIINNITDLAFNPNQKQRDFLYTISINPIVLFSGDGFVIFGQKTLQNKPSAFDRINVRRLFLTLERAVQNSLKYFVFEPNTEFTRTRLKNSIVPIFELAKNTEGLYDYLIVCDERNNTPDLIDRNELAVDIYIKPVRAAEFILVNFIATRTGQSFQELI
jgi:hypothetical protein